MLQKKHVLIKEYFLKRATKGTQFIINLIFQQH